MLALPLVLGGCTSDDGKKPTVLPSLAPPAASLSAVPVPSIPAEASAETSQGAAAFVRHYMVVLGAAIQNADPAPVQALSDAGCGGCQNLIRAIEVAKADRQRVEGAEFRVAFAVAPALTASDVIVDIRYDRAPGEVLDATGAVVRPIAPEPTVDAQVRMARTGSSWRVLGFRVVQT